MSLRTLSLAACLTLTLSACEEECEAATVDQQTALQYNGYSSGWSDCWQSYTAGKTGSLTAVQVWAFLPSNVTLTLYEGEGTSGRELGSTTALIDRGENRWEAAFPDVPQVAGATYTVRLTGTSDLNWVVGTYDYVGGVNNVYGGGADFGLTTYVGRSACEETAASVDQQTALEYNGYACGSDCWQSYTAGRTGSLTAVQVWAFLPSNVTLTLYEGEGTSGRTLGSTTSLLDRGDNRWEAALPNVPQTAGRTYTVRMTAASALNWVVGTYDYAGGVSNVYGDGADFGLTTWVRDSWDPTGGYASR